VGGALRTRLRSATARQAAKRLQKLLCNISVSFVDFAQQLFLQMSPRSLLYRATLGSYSLLLRLTFAPCSRFYGLGHVPDLRPARADVSLFWFCVRIHECLALLVSDKNERNRRQLHHNFINRRLVVNK
jgi:hypothetical protein